jgi:photosystem II stability/assembly factor-like uncharacterized protein
MPNCRYKDAEVPGPRYTPARRDAFAPRPSRRQAHRAFWTMLFAASLSFARTGAAAPQWQTQPTEAYAKKRDDIVFLTSRIGYYGTGKGRLFRTTDGGHSWELAWEHPGTFIRSLGFIDGQRGFLGNLGVGLAGTTDPVPLYRTGDGGRTWQAVQAGSASIAGVCAIDILHARAIVEGELRDRILVHAAGRANGPAQLLRSEDGGENWRVIDLSDRAGMILDVKFLDPDTGFVFAGTNADVAQSSALILKTSDGGRTWREVYRSPRKQEIIWKASFPSTRVAYATLQSNDDSNSQQRLLKTIDAGAHWLELPLVQNSKAQEFGIGFLDTRHGWIGTAVGGFETIDGGKAWKPANLAPKANKIRTHAVDGTPMIYAIGTEIQLLGPSE